MRARRIDLSLHLDTRPTRFVLVGVTGVGVSTAVLWLATQRLALSPGWGGLLASVTSTFTNFLLNDLVTWRDRRSSLLRMKAIRMVRYYSTTAAGNLVYLAVLQVLTSRLRLYVLVANIVAIGIGGAFNYLLHNVWTWRRGERG
jgi:dolichol-phosphate mannosyltransferase